MMEVDALSVGTVVLPVDSEGLKGKKPSFLQSKELSALGGTLQGLVAGILGITTVRDECVK